MPAQGNVTATTAVLRMKKPFIHEKTTATSPVLPLAGIRIPQPFRAAIRDQQPGRK
jgi:hypothetical protein